MPQIGAIVADRYRLDAVIGQGGYGRVFRATHLSLGTPVAVKVLRTIRGDDRQQRVAKRFRQEARASAKLTHANNVRVFDFGELDDGQLYIVMEFIAGTTLADVPCPADPRLVAAVLAQAAGALYEAHQTGMVHRDIKPANLMLTTTHGAPHIRVLDYGVTRVLDAETVQTEEGEFVGTIAYSAPEQFETSQVDARADIFSLGVVAYELLTDQRPFSAVAPAELIGAIVGSPPAPLPDDVPTELAELVTSMLAKHPDDRPRSMASVEAHARAFLLEAPPPRRPSATDDVTVSAAGLPLTSISQSSEGTEALDVQLGTAMSHEVDVPAQGSGPATESATPPAAPATGPAWRWIVAAALIGVSAAAVGYGYRGERAIPPASGHAEGPRAPEQAATAEVEELSVDPRPAVAAARAAVLPAQERAEGEAEATTLGSECATGCVATALTIQPPAPADRRADTRPRERDPERTPRAEPSRADELTRRILSAQPPGASDAP